MVSESRFESIKFYLNNWLKQQQTNALTVLSQGNIACGHFPTDFFVLCLKSPPTVSLVLDKFTLDPFFSKPSLKTFSFLIISRCPLSPTNHPHMVRYSGCVVECRTCNREVAGSNLSLGYFAPRSTQPSIPPGSRKWVPATAGKAKAGMAHSDYGWTCGCAGKTVKSLENTCHTWALLRWWFTTKRRYIKCTHLYLHLYLYIVVPKADQSETP